jgi:hypothetical protein
MAIDIEAYKIEDHNRLKLIVLLGTFAFNALAFAQDSDIPPPPPVVLEDNPKELFSAWLEGRSLVTSPDTLFCDSARTVVVDIWVDPKGDVVRAAFYRPASILLSTRCGELAVEHAKQLRFVTAPNATAEQKGRVLYRFPKR